MKKYKFIIWDFNGTILDDVEAGILSANKLLSDRGLSTIASREEYKEIFCFPITEYYKRLSFDFDMENFSDVAMEWVAQYDIHSKASGLCKNVKNALELFKGAGYSQHIISASEENLLRSQLKKLGVDSYFDEILGLDNYFGGSKEGIAHEWKKRHPDEAALFIGDTVHDYEVASSIGVDCALVEYGHQSRRVLEETGVRVFADAVEVFNELFKG